MKISKNHQKTFFTKSPQTKNIAAIVLVWGDSVKSVCFVLIKLYYSLIYFFSTPRGFPGSGGAQNAIFHFFIFYQNTEQSQNNQHNAPAWIDSTRQSPSQRSFSLSPISWLTASLIWISMTWRDSPNSSLFFTFFRAPGQENGPGGPKIALQTLN